MEYFLTIGGIGFRIISDFEITIEDSFSDFLCDKLSSLDVTIEFRQGFQQAPQLLGKKLGENVLLEFFSQDEDLICLAKGGEKGLMAITRCDSAYSRLVCCVDAEKIHLLNYLGSLLRLVPMQRILLHHNVLFFHAAQIAVGNTGILFTAPSGTGKTTQAKLWRATRGAPIICNDRALIHNGRTYGFPVDGSEPVRSGLIHDLGAIVLLRQNKTNSVQRLKPSAALAGLLSQLVIDRWDSQSSVLAMDQLMDLIRNYPVYLLECTPDTDAVACLEQRLIADGVIS